MSKIRLKKGLERNRGEEGQGKEKGGSSGEGWGRISVLDQKFIF